MARGKAIQSRYDVKGTRILDVGGAGRVSLPASNATVQAAGDVVPSVPSVALATYVVEKTTVNGFPSYTAKDAIGVLKTQFSDTPTTSGLKRVLESLAADNTIFHFAGAIGVPGVTRFHFLDAPTGLESWAGVEDHASFVRLHGLRFIGEGVDRIVLSNRSNQVANQGAVISALVETSNTITATTAVPHGLRIGSPVTIRGANPITFNGDYVVTAIPSATQFQVVSNLSGLGTASAPGVFDSGMVDTEPLSFTNCSNFEINNLTIESNGRAKSTTDCIDLDDGVNGLIHRVKVRASRARAITLDGGYNGQWAGKTTVKDNWINGRPNAPQCIALSGGALLATLQHQYCVSWVLNDLAVITPSAASYSGGTIAFTVPAVPPALVAGMQVNVVGMWPDAYNGSYHVSAVTGTTITVDRFWNGTLLTDPGSPATQFGSIVAPDETKPSDPTPLYTDTTYRSARIYLRPGPYNCVAQRIYRYDPTTAAWKLVGQTAVNDFGAPPVISQYDDTADPTTLSTAAFTHKSSIADAGIEVMAGLDCKIVDNFVDGVGDAVNGTNGYGINVVRKQYGPPSNQTGFNYESQRTLIRGNTVRQTAKDGIRVFGGDATKIVENSVSNVGTVSARASCIKIDSGTPAPNATSDHCIVAHNDVFDDQSAATFAGAATSQYGVSITAGVNNTQVKDNDFVRGGFFTQAILDAGTGTIIRGNEGWVTMNKGTANIAAAATTATVAHGLARTPSLADIKVTPTTTLGTAVRFWIQSPGASNFQIAVDVAPGQTITFSWAIDTTPSPG